MSPSSSRSQYRARLLPADLEVPVEIPEGFFDPNAAFPHFYSAGGWQGSDDDHRVDDGIPGYRVAYKTVKLFIVPDFVAEFSNLRLRVGQGSLERGGMRVRSDALPGRRWNQRIVPEYGAVQVINGTPSYSGTPDLGLQFSGWEETLERVSFVEIIARLDLESTESALDLLNAGRRAIASLRAQLDLIFGPRLLGPCLLEEVGSVFDDWHWNRRLDTLQLAAEAQVPVETLPAQRFAEMFSAAANRHLAKDLAQQRRLAMASRWYWLAEGEEDPVNRFLQLWIVIESLEMQTTSIRPVVGRLLELFPAADEPAWKDQIGRLFGLRGDLVHGKRLEVDSRRLHMVELVAKVMLSFHLTHTVPTPDGGRLWAVMNE